MKVGGWGLKPGFDFLDRAEPNLGDLEEDYRQHFLQSDLNQLRSLLPIYVITTVFYALIDFQLHRNSVLLPILFLLRFLIFLLSALSYFAFKDMKSVQKLDTLVLLWSIFVYLVALFVAYARSTIGFYDTSVGVIVVLITYLVIPNRLTYRLLPALIFSFCEMLISLSVRVTYNLTEILTSGIALTLANFVGYILSIRLYTFRRNQFKAQHQEKIARAEIEYLASIDGLTEIFNRRHFVEMSNQEFQQFVRHQRGFAILYLDIDFFKRINDKYGHSVGDMTLQQFASMVRSQIRDVDLWGRMGGEEFALLLPETSLEEARAVAERIRLHCEQMRIQNTIQNTVQIVSVTVSIGLTEVLTGDTRVDEILHRADQALYLAKQSGRNRVEVFGEHSKSI
jgi:diguanylate cyclase (GGDEF)-like protein